MSAWFCDIWRDYWTAQQSNEKIMETGDRVRAAGDPAIADQQELTGYNDTEEVLQQEVKGALAKELWQLMNPLPDQEQETILSRSYPIANFTWTGTQSRFSSLLDLAFPRDLLTIPQILSRTEYFSLFRAKAVRMRVKINSTLFHYGRLAIGNVPGLIQGTLDSFSAPIQMLNNDCVVMSAMTAADTTLTMEWAVNKPWIRLPLETTETAFMRKVSFVVLRPLRLASEPVATPVNVTVFAEFVEPEMTGMRGDSTIPSAIPTSHMVTDLSESVLKAEKQLDILDEETRDSITSAVEFVSPLADMALTAASVLDKPANVSTSAPYRPLFGGDIASMHGTDYSVKLGTGQDSGVAVEAGFAGPNEPSQPLLKCISKPGYYTGATFTSLFPPQSNVMQFPNDPGEVFLSSTEYYPDYLSWFSQNFYYWRGSIKYMFMFTCAKFVSCRIRITYYPQVSIFGPAPPLGPYAGDAISKVVDITGDTEIAFVVPYVSDTPYKKIKAFNDPPSRETSNGFIMLELVNSIATPDADVADVSIDVWRAAGADFQLNLFTGPRGPTNQLGYTCTLTPTCDINNCMDDAEELISFTSGREEKMVAPEMYTCITDFLKRYTTLGDANFSVVGQQEYLITSIPLSLADETDNIDHIAWLTAPFVWSRGGWRFRIYYPRDTFYPGTTTVVGDRPLEAILWPAGFDGNSAVTRRKFGPGVVLNNSTARYLAIEVPYYQNVQAIRRVRGRFDDHLIEVTAAQSTPQQLKNIIPWQRILYSAADDYSLGCLYSPPPLRVDTVPLESDLAGSSREIETKNSSNPDKKEKDYINYSPAKFEGKGAKASREQHHGAARLNPH